MPRELLKRITPHPHTLRDAWYLRAFGSRIADPRLWSLQRRSVTSAFGTGLALCFIPLPVHLILAALISVTRKINVPTTIATVLLVNPLTVVPVYYFAYRVGVLVLGLEPQHFAFSLSWDWLQRGLGPIWKPFLVGCLVCGVIAGITGWAVLEIVWRWRVRTKYRTRKSASSA